MGSARFETNLSKKITNFPFYPGRASVGEWRSPVSNVYQPVQWEQIQQPAPEVLKLPRVRMASKMRILFNHNLFKISVKCFQITTVIFPGVPQSHQGARDATKLVPSGTGGEVDTTTEMIDY